MKKVLIAIMSLAMIACNESGSDASESTSPKTDLVYGVDYDYDERHPDEISVDTEGKLLPRHILISEIKSHCGQSFRKNAWTGEVFRAYIENGKAYAKAMGAYVVEDYDFTDDQFHTITYKPLQLVSVGANVVISNYPSLSQYYSWTRANYTETPAHDNCMVIIDEENQDVLAVDLSTGQTSSIFN